MSRKGPEYLFCGSRLTDDTFVMRILLEGLNTQARQWTETITIQDDGSLEGLEYEVSMFKYLAYRRIPGGSWADPNVVLAFVDRMTHNRATERLLQQAEREKRPWFVIGSTGGNPPAQG